MNKNKIQLIPTLPKRYSVPGLLLLAMMLFHVSCKKYLEEKPRQDLAVPTKLSELQALLDYHGFNSIGAGNAEFMADNYYITSNAWNAQNIEIRKAYIWTNDAHNSVPSGWQVSYQGIYSSNFVLDLLPTIAYSSADKPVYDNIKGSALFHRGFILHHLAEVFCKHYSASTADNDPGLVIRLNSRINETYTRSSVKETYNRIISDLKEAAALLPESPLFNTRPGKAAAYGALARVYLSMSDYPNANAYAAAALALKNTLLDFKTLGSDLPSFLNNPEILFLNIDPAPYEVFNPTVARVDTLLYRSYAPNDLRKSIFYGAGTGVNAGSNYFKGSYAPDFLQLRESIFNGIATDEIYLIRAETLARANKSDSAMLYLNTLLRNRYDNSFVDLDASNALDKILAERRKELAFRSLRLTDIRRLNLAGAGIKGIRVINGDTYTLEPNDLRWVTLIPDVEISRSGIQQNPR